MRFWKQSNICLPFVGLKYVKQTAVSCSSQSLPFGVSPGLTTRLPMRPFSVEHSAALRPHALNLPEAQNQRVPAGRAIGVEIASGLPFSACVRGWP